MPRRRKTANLALMDQRITKIRAKVLVKNRFAVNAGGWVVFCVAGCVKRKSLQPDHPPERSHIHTIQLAARAIFWRVTRKASVRDNQPLRDRHRAGRDFQGGESRPVDFYEHE